VSEVDLHLHSTASDGRFSPAEIVHKAAELGLTVIALTDHDSVDGLAQAVAAAQAFPHLKVIPGIEISTDVPAGEAHVLGYFIDYTDQGFKASLEGLRHSRRRRAKGMVGKLGDLGIHIKWPRVREIAGSGTIGRPHIAQAMLEGGYIASIGEAFTRYIGRGGPAYVEREKMTPPQAVELVLRAGGLAVLAHPLTVGDPEAVVIELKAAGLVGVEVYYNGYTAQQVRRLLGLANGYGLIATGGSDYHGLDPATETVIGGAGVPLEAAHKLIALAGERAVRPAGR